MSVLLNRKCCATCEHWMGKRESSKSVRCENDRVLGVCINKKSSFKGKETQAGYHCANKYEQWTGYKK